MKKKSNNKVIVILYELIFAILALVVVSYAWFTYYDQVSTSGIDMNITGAINISISNDGVNWDTSTSITPNETMKLTELSGNGIDLYSPVVADKNVIGFTHVSNFSQTDNSYLEFKFYIKSSGPAAISYGAGCFVNPLNNSALKDNIAGAIRISCFESTGGKTPENAVVWVPNTTYEYNNGLVNKNGNVESNYTYAVGSSTTLKTINTNGKASGISEDKNFVWGEISEQMSMDMNPFLIINSEHGEETISEITVRVWVEGTDREAVRDLIGGQFKIHLSFKAGDVYE